MIKKKKIPQIQKQYKYDAETNSYFIEVLLDDYDDVYDEWDPAPFKKRFIEEKFNDFITTSAEDIPLQYNLIILLYLPENKKDYDKEQAVIAAYKNFYSYAEVKENRSWLTLRKKNYSYFVLAISLLAFGSIFLNESSNLFVGVLREGIFIGGWVFLWEVITNIFIVRREYKSRSKLYNRLYHSDIKFLYEK